MVTRMVTEALQKAKTLVYRQIDGTAFLFSLWNMVRTSISDSAGILMIINMCIQPLYYCHPVAVVSH